MHEPFGGFYRGRTVLVTGHTGFKGSWISLWLKSLGAKVVGYALAPPSEPSNFAVCGLPEEVVHIEGDIRDFDKLQAVMHEHRPEIVFHLAAQALVRPSFDEPRETFEINFMGTVNVLEAARHTDSVQAVVSITSDKCYDNVEWEWGYRESDRLGGHNAYSASKAAAEIAIQAYRDPRFQKTTQPCRPLPIASARAGNVIGGGDWASDRIIPDAVRAIASKQSITLRYPEATRPWLHVLEPLSGYLWLGSCLVSDPERFREAWNFGPSDERSISVQEIVDGILGRWEAPDTQVIIEPGQKGTESMLLSLDCSRARHHLGWSATYRIDETLDAVAEWYRQYYTVPGADMHALGVAQIDAYVARARELGMRWALEPATVAAAASTGGPS